MHVYVQNMRTGKTMNLVVSQNCIYKCPRDEKQRVEEEEVLYYSEV